MMIETFKSIWCTINNSLDLFAQSNQSWNWNDTFYVYFEENEKFIEQELINNIHRFVACSVYSFIP